MKILRCYKMTITRWLEDGALSYERLYAAVYEQSKAAAMRLAAENVKNFRSCKVEQVVNAEPGAAIGIKWIT